MTFLILFCLLVFTYYGVPWIYSRYKRYVSLNDCFSNNEMYLTFDDGPGEEITEDLCKLLDKYGVKATFFVLGKNAAENKEILLKCYHGGHAIYSHGFEHRNHWKVSPVSGINDLRKGWKELNNVLGLDKKKYPVRPPFGKLNIVSLLFLLINKVPILYWTLDSEDSWKTRPQAEAKLLPERKGTGIILLHDYDSRDGDRKEYVLDFTEKAIKSALDNNTNIKTL